MRKNSNYISLYEIEEMCTILKFAPTQTPEQALKKAEDRARTGEVILFPGVRYERYADIPLSKPASYSAGERDFLFL